jgi:WD40 repeat protein
VAFSPDGKTLATAGHDWRVRLWDVETWTEIRPIEGHDGPVQALAFAPDSRMLISGGLDQSIRFWDWPSGREVRRIDGLGTHWGVLGLSASPDGKSLLSVELDDPNGPFRLWDISTGNQLIRYGAKSGCTAAVAFMPDGKSVVAGQWNGAISQWDVATGKRLREVGTHKGNIVAVAPTPDGTAVAWAGNYQGLGLRDLKTGEERRRYHGSGHHTECGLALTPDSSLLITTGSGGPLHVWEVKTGQPAAGWPREVRGPRAVTCSPDGRLIAMGSYQGAALWDVLTRRKFRDLHGHRGEVRAVAFSPDGTTLATGGADGTVVVWDLTGCLKDGRLPTLALKADELDARWRDLGGDDANKAHHAVWSLTASAQTSIPFLQQRLKPIALVDTERLVDLIAKLGHETFAERERATRELSAMGEAADESLRRALANNPAPEAARRLDLLVKALDDPVPAGERIRRLRAVAVLEHVGDTPAVRLLVALAGGMPEARLTREATASLGRVRAKAAR